MSNLRATFRQPFTEAVAAFRLRMGNLVPTSRWDDLERNAHDRGFMVAGATKADLLADLAAAVDRANTEGTGIAAVRRDFRKIVERHGWHGWTGQGTARGEAWRTRVIYSTNLRVSMATGRLAQLRDGQFPFWVYRHSGAVEPRLDHLSWDRVVLPADHPFWATHYPPNDWGCGCLVRGARSRESARRVGGDPTKPLPENWRTQDPRTGAPVGIGKGWDYRPGDSVTDTIQAMAGKTVNWPYALARAFLDDAPERLQDQLSDAYRALQSLDDDLVRYARAALDAQRRGDQGALFRTLGRVPARHRTALADLLGIDLTDYQYTLTQDALRHAWRKHGPNAGEASRGQLALDVSDFGRLGRLLNAPDAIHTDGRNQLGQPVVRFERVFDGERLTASFSVGGKKRRHMMLNSLWKRAQRSSS